MKTDVRDELVALLPRLRRFAFSQTRSLPDADDLVQAACERALARIDQFQPGSRLDNWMFTIVRNIWIDNVRARARRPEVTNTDLAESVPYQDRITERAEARSDLHTLRKVMMKLPTDQLSVLTLVVVNGCTYQEAAKILDVPKGTVMSWLSRARAKLAASLDPAIPPPSSRQRTLAMTRPTEDMLNAYVDGELDPETARGVEEFLARDAPARAYVEALRRVNALLPEAMEELVPNLAPGAGRQAQGRRDPDANEVASRAYAMASPVRSIGAPASLCNRRFAGRNVRARSHVRHPLPERDARRSTCDGSAHARYCDCAALGKRSAG